jgi:hypothetical protein
MTGNIFSTVNKLLYFIYRKKKNVRKYFYIKERKINQINNIIWIPSNVKSFSILTIFGKSVTYYF